MQSGILRNKMLKCVTLSVLQTILVLVRTLLYVLQAKLKRVATVAPRDALGRNGGPTYSIGFLVKFYPKLMQITFF